VDIPRLAHVQIDGIVLAFAFLVSLLAVNDEVPRRIGGVWPTARV